MEEIKADIVVAGGVAAGMSAASQAKRLNPNLKVITFEKSPFISYGACGMPYFLSGEIPGYERLIALTPEKARDERGIEVYTEHEVSDVDPEGKTALVRDLKNGREIKVKWNKFILATGARAVLPPIPGLEGEGIFTLRDLNDGIRLKNFITQKKPGRVLIIGGGPIGCEMAEGLRKLNIEVVLVEVLPEIMPILDPDMGSLVREELINAGVKVFVNEKIEKIERRNERILVHGGSHAWEVDLVLAGTGVKPNSELLTRKGAHPGPRGSVDVDEHTRTSVPDVLACGDCADVLHLVTGKKVYVPLGTTANKQGRVAGAVAAGVEASFPGITGTAAVKVFNLEVARTGLSEAEAVKEGFDVESVSVKTRSRAGYYPGSQRIYVKLVYEKKTRRLLGAQIVGREGASKRIDTVSAVLYFKGSVRDLYNVDFSYAPPFAPVYDPLAVAARKADRWK